MKRIIPSAAMSVWTVSRLSRSSNALTASLKKDTGYSINNAANGVFLPSWDRARWGTGKPDGKWGDQDDDIKYEIMKIAMRGLVGQAHIGSHDGKVHSETSRQLSLSS